MAKTKDQLVWKELLTGTEKDGEIVSNVRGKITCWENESRDTRRQWMLNSAFARGQQYSVFARNEDRLISVPLPPGRKQVMDDMIGPWKVRRIADMVIAEPEPTVIPALRRDSKSITAARRGKELLEYYRTEWRFQERYIQISGYLIDFANCFVYYNYLEEIKREAVPALNDNNEILESATGEIQYDVRMVDDIVEQILTPQQVACQLDDSPFHEKRWCVMRFNRTLDYMIGRYGDEAKDLQPMSDNQSDIYALYNIADSKPEQVYGKFPYVQEEIYLQVPTETTKGWIFCLSGNTLLKKIPWPYNKLSILPIVHFHGPKESGEFYARSSIEIQMPLQKALNKLRSIVIENADAMAHAKTLIPDQGETETPTDAPDIIRYLHPYIPSQMVIAAMPEYVFGVGGIEGLRAAIRDIQAQHGPTVGTSASGVRSGIHAENLQEQDLKSFAPLDRLMESAFARAYEIILTIAAEKVNDRRTLSYTDRSGREFSVENFRGAMLGDVQRVKVRMMNTNLRSPGAVKQEIYEWFAAGMIKNNITKQPDDMKALRMLEFALPEGVFEEYRIHSDRAYHENELMLRGEVVEPYPFQDLLIHLQCHDELLNSSEYYEKLESDDPADQEIVKNINQHIGLTQQMYQDAIQPLMPKGEVTPETEGAAQTGGAEQTTGA